MFNQWIVGLCLVAVVGCASPPAPVDRQKKLLSMASEEVQFITDPRDRLTRQLNFAFDQINRHQATEAKASLASAAKTLGGAKPGDLDSQTLLAGWVSISELSRSIDDKPAAKQACDRAVAALHRIEPPTDRPPFVTGVAFEIRQLEGPEAAAGLLRESVAWATPIKEIATRRTAVAMIADGIFQCDDYDGGLVALRTDNDAAWRSDTLKRFAQDSQDRRSLDWTMSATGGVVAGSKMNSSRFAPLSVTQNEVTDATATRDGNGNVILSTPAPTSAETYAKPVDFGSVFRQSK